MHIIWEPMCLLSAFRLGKLLPQRLKRGEVQGNRIIRQLRREFDRADKLKTQFDPSRVAWHECSFCCKCVEDPGLKAFISANAQETVCTICGTTAHEPIAAWASDIAEHALNCIQSDYEDAVDCLPYESAEGG